MFDPYRNDAPGVGEPSTNLIDITLDDDNDLAVGIKALRIFNPTDAVATLKITTLIGNAVTVSIPAGGLVVEPVRVARVWETGSTADLEIHGYTDIAEPA